MENVLIMKDYYKILEVNRNASIDDIKKQYKILAKKYHPDKGGNEDKFKEISEAFQNLSDPLKKRNYDLNNLNLDNYNYRGFSSLFNNNYDLNNIFNNMNINISNYSESRQTNIRDNIKIEKITRNHNGKKIIIITETNLHTGNKSQKIIEQ